MPAVASRSAPDAAAVLTRAVSRAGAALGLSQRALGEVIGVSASSMSRLVGPPEKAGGGRGRTIDPGSKEGELALLFVRLYRSLDALVGGDESKARAWLYAFNHHLGAVPAERVRSVQGLVDVVEYLDAMRGTI